MYSINPQIETQKIVSFVKQTLIMQGFQNVVLGLSGGIDSATVLYLLAKSIPPKNIFVAQLPYFQKPSPLINQALDDLNIPEINRYIHTIKNIVDGLTQQVARGERLPAARTAGALTEGKPLAESAVKSHESQLLIRQGNIMARVRMIILFDLAKKNNALVCGTENKSEHLLGYFTRFGDAASDFEPIQHLYKTQVKLLAQHLGVPKKIIDQVPTAGLWSGQTDEKEFGFTYEEADQVLYLHYDKKLLLSEIEKKGFKHAKAILARYRANEFKHKVPYTMG